MHVIDKSRFSTFPDFNYKEVEVLYNYDLSLPDEVYEELLQKDRKLLIEDLEKVLYHAVVEFKNFSAKNVPEENTFFVWHALD